MSSLQPVQHQVTGTPQAKGFQSFFRQLPEKLATTVRVFDRGEYYTVHGADAHMVAQLVFKTTSVVRKFSEGDSQLEYVTLSRMNFESLLRDLLLVQRYRVEVYKCKSGARSSGNDWCLEYQGSPGNVAQFEDLLYGSTGLVEEAGGVLSVHVVSQSDSGKCVGAAVVDNTLQRISVTEFVDSSDTLCSLEALVVQMAPRECILCPTDPSADVVRQIMSRNRVLVTEAKRGDFNARHIIADLQRLLKPPSASSSSKSRGSGGENGAPDTITAAHRPETALRLAMQALAAAIVYLKLLHSDCVSSDAAASVTGDSDTAGGSGDGGGSGHYTLDQCDVTQHVRLDAAAVHALNLLPPVPLGGAGAVSDSASSCSSVFAVLNRCVTGQGSRLLAQWLRQPLTDLGRIEERLQLVEMAVELSHVRVQLSEQRLRQLPDLQRLCRRLQRRRASLIDCFRVYKAVQQLHPLVQCLEDVDAKYRSVVDVNFVQPLKQCLQDFQKFMEMIESTVDLESADKEVYVVKAEFDEELQELRRRMDELEVQFDKLLASAADQLGLEQRKSVKLESTPQMGYYFRVTRKEERVLRGQKSFHIVETNKSGVKFRSSRLAQLNDEYQTASRAFNEQQQAVVDEIVAIAAGYLESIRRLNETVAFIDCIISMATAAVSAPVPYVRPQLTPLGEKGVTELLQLRHPCVEQQEGVSFIANDVRFEHDKLTFKVITGPNMAGKSTYIRSVAVAVIMAQIGSFVPCESARICCVDAVMTRVGAGDCQTRGVSTFMAEMLETATILRSATRNSLLVIDELGRGTSTYDGFGLAWAISEHIVREIGAFTLFATHYHELSELSDHSTITGVENLHVTAIVTPTSAETDNVGLVSGDVGVGDTGATCRSQLTFLYRVTPGVCDRSFGVHVAEMVRFDRRVLEDARNRASRLECMSGGLTVDSSDALSTTGQITGSVKRARSEIQEGMCQIDKFLAEYDAIEGGEDKRQRVHELMQTIRQENNSFVSNLLHQHCLA